MSVFPFKHDVLLFLALKLCTSLMHSIWLNVKHLGSVLIWSRLYLDLTVIYQEIIVIFVFLL